MLDRKVGSWLRGSRNHHLTVVEGFERPSDPGSCVVMGVASGRVSQGKVVSGEGPDQE